MEDYPLLNLFWTMLIFFFFVVWIWLVITIFVDIFRRNDHSGWAKAGWTILIILLPFLGVLIYMIARPDMTEQDKEMIKRYQEEQKRMAGYSPSEELERLQRLKDQGAITEDDYNKLKAGIVA